MEIGRQQIRSYVGVVELLIALVMELGFSQVHEQSAIRNMRRHTCFWDDFPECDIPVCHGIQKLNERFVNKDYEGVWRRDYCDGAYDL